MKNRIYNIFLLSKITNIFKIIYAISYWKLFYNRVFIFKFIFKNKKFNIYADSYMDFISIRETFIDREYEFEYLNNPEIIIDLGANVGDTAIYYSLKFPNAKIYAVEPNAKVFAKLVKNTEQFKNINRYECAIGNETKKIEFSYSENHFGGSVIKRSHNKEISEVQMYSLTDFAKKENIDKIDILKFDIEGAEEFLLQDDFLKVSTRQMVGEVHDDLTSENMENIISNLNIKSKIVKQISKNRYILFGNVA